MLVSEVLVAESEACARGAEGMMDGWELGSIQQQACSQASCRAAAVSSRTALPLLLPSRRGRCFPSPRLLARTLCTHPCFLTPTVRGVASTPHSCACCPHSAASCTASTDLRTYLMERAGSGGRPSGQQQCAEGGEVAGVHHDG